ncbi:hypothetical protein M9458_055805 [Cirrhinus mrigala]|uniref:Retrotransposon gag domain-containing protein n=1 Tax=Cirrhinus mrigala TaxID=683832 RepID=A0ABD0MIV7_CIRMR
MFRAEEKIMNIRRAGRPLEQYVEEFLDVCHLVSWNDPMINTCFLMGLNDDQLQCSISFEDRCKPVAEFINLVLARSHSNFYVDVEDSNLPPIRKHAAAPTHHQPASSTYCSDEPALSGHPSLPPISHNSSPIISLAWTPLHSAVDSDSSRDRGQDSDSACGRPFEVTADHDGQRAGPTTSVCAGS